MFKIFKPMNLICATLLVALFQTMQGQTAPEVQQVIQLSQNLMAPSNDTHVLLSRLHQDVVIAQREAAKADFQNGAVGIHEQLLAESNKGGKFDADTIMMFQKLSRDLSNERARVASAEVGKNNDVQALLNNLTSLAVNLPKVLKPSEIPAVQMVQLAQNKP